MHKRATRNPIRTWLRNAVVGLSVTVFGLLMGFGFSQATAKSIMSCGSIYAPKPVSKPRNCSWSFDGSYGHTVSLRHLSWRNWGSRRATATGRLKDLHDQDNNGFQSRRVRVVVFGRERGISDSNFYYRKMRVSGVHFRGHTFIPLYPN